jgi:uncharacterized protein (DUF2141 family)
VLRFLRGKQPPAGAEAAHNRRATAVTKTRVVFTHLDIKEGSYALRNTRYS